MVAWRPAFGVWRSDRCLGVVWRSALGVAIGVGRGMWTSPLGMEIAVGRGMWTLPLGMEVVGCGHRR